MCPAPTWLRYKCRTNDFAADDCDDADEDADEDGDVDIDDVHVKEDPYGSSIKIFNMLLIKLLVMMPLLK